MAAARDRRAERRFHQQRLQAPRRRGRAGRHGHSDRLSDRRTRPPGPDVCLPAARAIESVSGVYPDIKWTNDLVLGGKKLCGILTEIGIEAESREVDYAVVGIGINCERVDLPPEVSAMSTSLEAFTGQKPGRARLAAALVRSLCEMERALFTEKEAWLREFSAHCITLGQDVRLVRGDDVTYAHADAIDADAALLVTLPDGTKSAIASGEVSVRGMYGYV